MTKYGQLTTKMSIARTRRDITETLKRWGKKLIDIRIGMRDVEIVLEGAGGKPQPFKCNRFPTPEQNMRALFLALDGVRLMEQRGILQEVAEVVSGLLAAPGQRDRPWWEVLGILPDSPEHTIKAVFKEAAKQFHPDSGREPNPEAMAAINVAYDQAKKERGFA